MRLAAKPRKVLHLGGGLSVVDGGGAAQTYAQRVKALSPIAYWPLNEPLGTSGAGSVLDASGNGHHATPGNVTFGAVGIGDGSTAATFNGSNSVVDAFSAGLAGVFNGAEGSICMWLAAAWSGLTYALYLNGNTLQVFNVADALYLIYGAGGVDRQHTPTGMSSSAFTSVGMTWSKSNDRKAAYLAGANIDPILTGLGTFVGPLTQFFFGAFSGAGAFSWNGKIAHVALFDKELTAAQMAALANP